MKKFFFAAIICLVVVLFYDGCSSTPPISYSDGKKTTRSIAEMKYLDINGWKQFTLVRGTDTVNNPVLLLLHGGPGASTTALSRHYNSALEKDFTVVYWDQRGAGKSYSSKIDTSTLHVKQLVADASVLIDYLRNRFKKEKIFIIGHSWGSRLGMYLVRDFPGRINAFIGTGQEVAPYEGELQSYEYTLEQAKATRNTEAIKDLVEMGEPQNGNYLSMYKTGFWGTVKQKDWLLEFGGERYEKTSYTDWLFQMLLSDEYSLSDLVNWGRASAATAGKMVMDPDFSDFDFRQDIPTVELPVYFISGLHDYNTPWPLVKQYCEQLKAPVKGFYLFEKSGHSVPFEEPDRFNALVRKLFLHAGPQNK